jgi:ribulose-phosphate 3-epimerase
MLPKIEMAAKWRRDLQVDYRIEVDGGIDLVTGVECARAGADTFVAGTSLFKHRQLGQAVAKMRAALKGEEPKPARRKRGRRR